MSSGLTPKNHLTLLPSIDLTPVITQLECVWETDGIATLSWLLIVIVTKF